MSIDLTTCPIEPIFFETQADTRLTWLGMAGAMINVHGVVILIDPLLSLLHTPGQLVCEAGYRLKLPLPINACEIPRVDLVLYTHADDDHFGRLTAKRLANRLGCRFLAPAPVAHGLIEMGIAKERVQVALEDDTVRIGPVEICVTPAMHDWQEENPWQRGDCCGFLIHTPDGTIWHPGDTRMIDELLTIKGVDVLFFDVAAVESHLGPEGSAQLAASCGAKRLIAYHYGTFDLPLGSFGNCDPQDALPYLEGLAVDFLQLNPGEVMRLTAGK